MTERLVWTLAHSLWQVALVAIIAAIALRMFSRRRAETRYAITAAAMALSLGLPFATFTFHAEAAAIFRAVLRFAGFFRGHDGMAAMSGGLLVSPPFGQTVIAWILPVWIAGVSLGTIRLAAGWNATRRLVRSASEAASEEATAILNRLRRQLGIAHSIRLLLSGQIDTPAAVGFWRPVVLMPVSAMTGLDPDLLRAVLAHELAHIRRHDFAINVLQSCVESLLFFHPGVWWLSRRMRAEREHCCDDVAVRVCGDPAVYARALLVLERSGDGGPALAMGAGGGSVKARLLRVLGRPFERRSWGEALGMAMLLLAVVVGIAWPSQATHAEPALSASASARQALPPAISVAPGPSTGGPARASVAAELLAVVTSLAQDPAQPGNVGAQTGVVGGLVRDANGMPAVPGTQIRATPVVRPILNNSYIAETQAQGRYRMEVPPGTYRITVQDFNGAYRGIIDFAPVLVTVQAGETVTDFDLNFTIAPYFAASGFWGTVTFDDGSPLPIGSLTQFQLALTSERDRWVTQPFTYTQGVFMSMQAVPGEYAVTVAPLPLGVYLKSVTCEDVDLTKAPISLASISKDERIEVVLTKTRPPNAPAEAKVSGRITGWQPGSAPLVLMAPWNTKEFHLDRQWQGIPPAGTGFVKVATLTPRNDGTFEIAGVPSGRYVIGRSEADRSLAFDVAGSDVSGIELTIDKNRFPVALFSNEKRTISGIVESSNGPVPPFEIVFASKLAGAKDPVTAAISSREFTITVPPDEYTVSVAGLPNGYTLKSITAGPLDLTYPFLVTSAGIADGFSGKPIATGGNDTITIRLVSTSVN